MFASLENARLLAGGQSLIAMLNTRYVMLDHLIDLKRIPGLDGVEINEKSVRIGALTRQNHAMHHAELIQRAPIFSETLRYVGHTQTRNRGTIGGSIAHMDPAAELMGVAALLDATIHAESVRGSRDIPIAGYPLSYMTPNLQPDEMITAVSFRLPAETHGWAFTEFVQRHGDFAVVGAGAILQKSPANDAFEMARIVLIGTGPAPLRLYDAEKLLVGEKFTPQIAEACADIARRAEAMGDTMASSAFRQRLRRSVEGDAS